MPGYIHRLEASSFNPGTDAKKLVELGYEKTVGANGSFAVDPLNGFSTAMPTADRYRNLQSFKGSLEEHNSLVQHYFVAAGLPKDQIGSISGGAEVREEGSNDAFESGTQSQRIVGFRTIIMRAVDGVEVPYSRAMAMLDADGRVFTEFVYWPSLSSDLFTAAKEWQQTLASQGAEEGYRSSVSTEIDWTNSRTHVVVLHAPGFLRGTPLGAQVAYEVELPETVRFFDQQGRELHVVNE